MRYSTGVFATASSSLPVHHSSILAPSDIFCLVSCYFAFALLVLSFTVFGGEDDISEEDDDD